MTDQLERTRTVVRVRWDALLSALAIGAIGFTLGMAAQAELDRAMPACPPAMICTPI